MHNEPVPDAFYERLTPADAPVARFASTESTRGPWDIAAQHAGPPAALLGHEIETRRDARADMRVARITLDILRPVPIGELTVTTRVEHASRSIEIVEAVLTTVDGRVTMRASALRIRGNNGESRHAEKDDLTTQSAGAQITHFRPPPPCGLARPVSESRSSHHVCRL